MEHETQEQNVVQVEQQSSLHQVTPLSKYLAMVLFIALPFLGGWIGYTYTPEKVVEVEKVVEIVKEMTVEAAATVKEESSNNFPVIAFEREGFLTSSERALLNKKFIEPYVDYYQMSEDNTLLTTVIEVPQEVGEPYVVSNVMSDGTSGGFLFGSRGVDYFYWAPGCFHECEFTDAYVQKHPEVIQQYKKNLAP